MKQAKTTKQPLEDKKHVPRWLQNELYDLSMPYVDKMIEAHKKEGIGFSRFSLQSMGEQLICMGYFHANPTPPEEKPTPDSKEGLHTQGEKWFVDLGNYDREGDSSEIIIRKEMNGELYDICSMTVDETNFPKDHAEYIVKAVNERKALLDSHRELLEAAKKAQECFRKIYDNYEQGADFDDIYNNEAYWPLSTLETAINNAKNI